MKQQLNDEIQELHRVIENELPADECTASNLKQVTDELQIALETGKSPQNEVEGQLEQEMLKFGEEHPAISLAIKNLMNSLSSMGI